MSDNKKLYLDGHEIKVGDRLYHLLRGWLVVANAYYHSTMRDYVLVLRDVASGDNFSMYQSSPNLEDDSERVLYWDEVKITPPPKPKKKEMRYQWLMEFEGSCYVTRDKFNAVEAQERFVGIPIRPIEETGEEFEAPE